MISTNSYVYTDTGIYKIDELYTIVKESSVIKPKLMTLDTINLVYKFVDNYTITKKPEEITDVNISITEFNQILECKFSDIFSNRIITVDCTEDTYILQYNVLKTNNNPIDQTNYGILKYLRSNRNKSKLDLGWKLIKNLLNYSTYMPNICLGDTITKYISKEVRNKEIGFEIYETDISGIIIDTLPIFVCQNISTFYNFILVKGYNKTN